MMLSAKQLEALDEGKPVSVSIADRECVVIRRDAYNRAKDVACNYDDSEMDPREAYPWVDVVMAEDDANDPTLRYYQEEP